MSEVQDKSPSQSVAPISQSVGPHPHPGQHAIYQVQQPSAYTVGYPPMYPFMPSPAHEANGQSSGDPNAPPPGHYMMAFPPPPPGMIYAYSAAQPMPSPSGMTLPQALVRPKRKQCTNCASACKRCDEARPCQRCIKYNQQDTCVNGQRKERKKGVKRGPYKRKDKPPEEEYEEVPAEPQPAPGGFYQPYFYPPPGFVPVGPDGQPMHSDPSQAAPPPHTNGQAVGAQAPQYYMQPYPFTPFTPHAHGIPYPFPSHMIPQQQPPPGSGAGADMAGRGACGSSADGSPDTPSPPVMAPMTPVSAAEETHPSNVVGANGVGQTTSGRGRKRKSAASRSAENGKDGQAPTKRVPASRAGRAGSAARPASSQAQVPAPSANADAQQASVSAETTLQQQNGGA